MNGLRAVGRLLADGRAFPIHTISRLRLEESLSCPAASLSFTAPVDRFPGELGAIRVEADRRTLFEGQVDTQTASLSGSGRLLRVEARDRGAHLLDNEALPCALTNLQLPTLFHLCAAPYGFSLYDPEPRGGLALYTIHKGQCEWDALCGYVARVYGLRPFVRDGTVVVDRPRSASTLVIGEGGHPFCDIEHIHSPYSIMSSVVLRDGDGGYSSAVHNPDAAYYGVRRRRYCIPANEFTDSPALDANQKIRRSMLGKETVKVTLPGFISTYRGQAARVAGPELVVDNLLVERLVLDVGEAGVFTVLELVSSVYY